MFCLTVQILLTIKTIDFAIKRNMAKKGDTALANTAIFYRIFVFLARSFFFENAFTFDVRVVRRVKNDPLRTGDPGLMQGSAKLPWQRHTIF